MMSSPDMRIGDAERTEVADHLAHHFSDGRLDEAEFGERLDRAMRARTMADLSGLLADLPGEPASPAAPPPGDRHQQRKMLRTQLERERLALKSERRAHRRAGREVRWRSARLLALLVTLVVSAMIVAHWLAHSVAIWIVVGVIAFLWLRRRAARSHRDGRRDPDGPGY